MDELKDKVVVVTGGSSGIGLAIIKRLLNNDVKFVAMFELGSPKAREVFEELENANKTKIGFYPCDVTNTSQLEGNFESVFRMHGTVDILVNNAGVFTENAPGRMIDINYKAVVLGSLMMIERVGKHNGGKGGTIVNVASVLGLRTLGHASFPIYGSTKSAIVAFTETMKTSFHLTGVRVVAICPGLTDTPMRIFGIFATMDAFEIQHEQTMQSPDHVAAAVMQLIRKGNCGDLWVSENEEPPYSVVIREEIVKRHL